MLEHRLERMPGVSLLVFEKLLHLKSVGHLSLALHLLLYLLLLGGFGSFALLLLLALLLKRNPLALRFGLSRELLLAGVLLLTGLLLLKGQLLLASLLLLTGELLLACLLLLPLNLSESLALSLSLEPALEFSVLLLLAQLFLLHGDALILSFLPLSLLLLLAASLFFGLSHGPLFLLALQLYEAFIFSILDPFPLSLFLQASLGLDLLLLASEGLRGIVLPFNPLSLVSVGLCEVDLEAGVNDLVEALANGGLGLVLLLDRQDALDLPLALLDRPLHVVVVAAHLGDQLLVLVLLGDDRRVAPLLDEVFDFNPALLVQLFELEAKALLFAAQKGLKFAKVGRRLDFCEHGGLDFGDLGVDAEEELVDLGLEGLGDDLGRDLVHILQGALVGRKLLIEEVLEARGHVGGESQLLEGLLHVFHLVVNALVAHQLLLLVVEGHEEVAVDGAVLVGHGRLRQRNAVLGIG